MQDGASPIMEEIIFFHDFTMVVVVFILSFVGRAMAGAMVNRAVDVGLLERQSVECVWTVVPALILTQVAVPSLALLYLLDEGLSPSMTLKVTGHQWY